MKKIFTFLALLFVAMTTVTSAYAADTDADGVILGFDNYRPGGSSFRWKFDIDFTKQKFVAVVNVNSCRKGEPDENIASIGTDIKNDLSELEDGGNIHIYYTLNSKTLKCFYLSGANEIGSWRYTLEKENVTGDVTIELSRQFGLRVNGEQVFNPSQLELLLKHSNLQFGSMEGTHRSRATYTKTRVSDTSFEAVDATSNTAKAKLLYKGTYSRYDAAKVLYRPTSFTEAELTLSQLAIDGKVLGDVVVSGVAYRCYESRGDDSPGKIDLTLENGKGKIVNLGEKGTELALTEGQEIEVPSVDAKFYGERLEGEVKFRIGSDELVYDHSVADPAKNTYTSALATSFSGSDKEYEGKTLVVNNYGDGFADIAINNIEFASLAGQDLGNLVIKGVPYSYNATGEQVFACENVEAILENCPTDLMKNFSGVKLEGKISGNDTYFVVEGKALSDMPVKLVFGKEIAAFTTYTAKQSVRHSSFLDEEDAATLSVRPAGEGKYAICLTNIADESYLTFTADATTHTNGEVTYAAEKVEVPMMSLGWIGENAYISIKEAKSEGNRFYGVFTVDLGGYGAQGYTSYIYTVTFGEEFTGINAVNGATEATPMEYYTVSGTRANALQKGVNIVRMSDGKTVKVVKK